MSNFIVGFIFGIVVMTIGVQGIAKVFDNGVSKIQEISKEAAK
jgi:hypothetical protein